MLNPIAKVSVNQVQGDRTEFYFIAICGPGGRLEDFQHLTTAHRVAAIETASGAWRYFSVTRMQFAGVWCPLGRIKST